MSAPARRDGPGIADRVARLAARRGVGIQAIYAERDEAALERLVRACEQADLQAIKTGKVSAILPLLLRRPR